METQRFLILTGGRLEDGLVKKVMQMFPYSCLICVDGALAYADRHNISVDYIIGDFDTVDEEILKRYKEKSGEQTPEIIQFPPEKDAVDTQLAMELAIQKGAGEIYLLGATGTRFDHTLANVEMLRIPLQYGIQAYILDEHNRICVIDKQFRRKKQDAYGTYLSVLPYGEKASGVTIKGVKYETRKETFIKGNSLGVSNEITDEEAVIQVDEGMLIVIESND